MNHNELLDFFIDNLKKFFYPEEWINLDLSFSKSELFTMLLIEKHGEIIMSQIADYTGVPMSTATGVVDRLVKHGYLIRERSESDRRIVVIKLTAKGKGLVDELKSTAMNYIKLIYDSLTDEERLLLGKIFTKVMRVFNEKNLHDGEEEEEANKVKKIEIE
ncbi:MAG: MarR family winged helix-turn-helix transcriptional regulator [Bacillota bacterium]